MAPYFPLFRGVVSPVSSNTALLQLLASIEAVTAARVDRTAAADYHAALRELEAARNSEARIRGLEDSASQSSIQRFIITEKAPTRACLVLVESGYYRFYI